MTEELRDEERKEIILARRYQIRGTINVSMPKLSKQDQERAAQWFGLPPSRPEIPKRPPSAF